MEWERLLSLKRFGDRHKRLRKEQDDTRLGFEVDYDRIIFSSAFRSLQDKTQVVPMSKTDFVHTRLTHSLEVSVVGRSLGRIAGKHIVERHPQLQATHGYFFSDFGAIVAAAALAHDIGNPPFGHSGEKAIGEYFLNGNGQRFKDYLTPKEFQDMTDFEGNANGFRLLTESREGVTGGLRLSYATLGAFMKYPKESLPKKPTPNVKDKKFGFFQSEKDAFNDVAEDLGLLQGPTDHGLDYVRHPLAYLVEAADDICYTIIDFEDGINLGLIPEDFALEYLINLVKDSINTGKYHALRYQSDRLSYLRALAINTLIQDTANLFLDYETDILAGQFHTSLIDKSSFKAQIEDIIALSVDKIYRSNEVMEKEIAGYRIIADLLDVYIGAMVRRSEGRASNYDRLVIRSLPEELRNAEAPLYSILMRACCYVAGLSDRSAVQMHTKIMGNSL